MRHRFLAMLSIVVLAGCAGASTPGRTFGPQGSGGVPTDRVASTPALTGESAAPPAPSRLSPVQSPLAASPGPTSTPAVSAADPRAGGLDVAFGEWAIVPEATAIRPGKVRFVVKNGGDLTHGFEIEREDGNASEFEVEGPEFRGGETVEISATLEPGTYEIYCYIGDHEDRGMTTQLVVRTDAPLQTAPPPAKAYEVSISGFAFDPTPLHVPVGTAVSWTNQDPTDHTVTADGAAFGSDAIAEGQSFTKRFDSPGTFSYFCAIHPSMRGRIEVT